MVCRPNPIYRAMASSLWGSLLVGKFGCEGVVTILSPLSSCQITKPYTAGWNPAQDVATQLDQAKASPTPVAWAAPHHGYKI